VRVQLDSQKEEKPKDAEVLPEVQAVRLEINNLALALPRTSSDRSGDAAEE
jgi:hypothetical protein